MREVIALLRAGGLRPRRSLAALASLSLVAVTAEAGAMLLAVRIFGLLFEEEGAQVVVAGESVRPLLACALGLAAVLVGALADYVIGRRTASLSTEFLSGLRSGLAYDMARADHALQREFGGGRVTDLMTSTAYQASLLPMRAATMASAGAATAALLCIAFVVEPRAAAALLVAGVVLIAMMRPIGRRTSSAADVHTRAQTGLADASSAWSTRLAEMRLFGVDLAATAPVAAEVEKASEALRVLRARAFTGVVVYRSVTIALLLVLVMVAAVVRPVEALDAALVLLIVLRSLSYSQQFNAARQVAFEAVGPTRELVRTRRLLSEGQRAMGTAELSQSCDLNVQRLRIRVNDEDVLVAASFRIRSGDRVAFVGPSGAGKSLLLDVLSGVRRPDDGSVALGDVPIEALDADGWARFRAYASQEPCIINATLSDNVRFFRDWLLDRDIDAGIRAVGLDRGGLLDRGSVGGGTAGLSGGQAQRVGIARALAGRPTLLLLDEPTSALDADAEDVVIASLAGIPADVTLVIVTHRPAPLSVCDRFFALSAGELVELPDRESAVAFCAAEERTKR